MADGVDESTEYESCIGEKVEMPKEANLNEFIGMEDEVEKEPEWKEHWVGMPEFTQEENKPFKRITISFQTEDDYKAFAVFIDQKLTNKTKSIWFPKLNKSKNSLLRWIEEE